MEIKLFHETFTEQNPKPLMDHMQRMASGEAPFFPATLSLVIGTLARKVLPRPITSGSRLGKSREIWDQSAIETAPAIQVSNSTPDVDPSLTPSTIPSSSSQDPASASGPSGAENNTVSLICPRCRRISSSSSGLRCPRCRCRPKKAQRTELPPFMRCARCNTQRKVLRVDCGGPGRGAVFV